MKRPLRILVATPLPSTVTGGIEEYAYAVIDTLRAQGNEVRVLTTRYAEVPDQTEEGSRTTYLTARELLGRPVCVNPLEYARVLSLVRWSDIVHVHMPFPFVETYVAGAAKWMGKPVVVTYHMDAVVDVATPGPPRWLHRAAERIYRMVSAVPTVNLADRVCTNTQAYALQSPVLSPRMGRLSVVHQGIDPKKFHQFSRATADRVRKQILGEEYSSLVCFVGRLVPYKGLDVLLEAFRSLNRERTLLIIGGRGPQEAHLRQLIQDYQLPNVRLIGFVPDDDLVNLFGAADLVVSPSVSPLESTPITLLYAQAAGTRVVGTDVGGTAESIPNDGIAGLVVPSSNPGELAKAIRILLDAGPVPRPDSGPRFWSHVAEEYGRTMHQLRAGRTFDPTARPGSSSIPFRGPSETGGGRG